MKNIFTEQAGKLFILETGSENSNSIIFLHVVCSSSNMWLNQLKALTNFHCIAPDFPGHGKRRKCEWTLGKNNYGKLR